MRVAALLMAGCLLVLGWRIAAAAEYEFVARFEWQSEGEIRQVWFHREFDGRLFQTSPIEVDSAPLILALLEDVSLDCEAHAAFGLPNWSEISSSCILSNANGELTVEVTECAGTHKGCEGTWHFGDGFGRLTDAEGQGVVRSYLLEPSPLPWLYNGPIIGYSELRGVILLP